MADVVVRSIAPTEYEVAGTLVREAYRSLGDVGDELYEKELQDVASRVETGQVFVAEADGRIVGCVTVAFGQTNLSEVDDQQAATVRMLGVSADARGRGVGARLMQRCIDEARAQGARRVRLDTRTSMKDAQGLYERLGFVRDPTHDWSPASGISLLAYVLELDE